LPSVSLENLSGSWSGSIDADLVGVQTFTFTPFSTCAVPANLSVTVVALPTVVLTSNNGSLCAGESLVLTASGAQSYTWNNGILGHEATQTVAPTVSTTYQVIGIDENGCQGTASITIKPLPTSVSSQTIILCENEIPYLWNGQNLSLSGTYSYSTTNSVGCDSTISLFLTIVPPTQTQIDSVVYAHTLPFSWLGQLIDSLGAYSHTSIHLDSHGCDSTVVFTLTVLHSGQSPSEEYFDDLFFVPNAFTPDGGNFNETFYPVVAPDMLVQEFLFEIYDRWGERIFISNQLEARWDGRINGKPAPDGVYSWVLFVESATDHSTYRVTGFVTLIR